MTDTNTPRADSLLNRALSKQNETCPFPNECGNYKHLLGVLAARDAELAAMKPAYDEQLRASHARELVYVKAHEEMKQRAEAAEKRSEFFDEVGRQLGRKLAEEIDERKAAERRAEESARDAKEAIAIAGLLFDAWEDGQPCYETDGESGMGASIGNAFRLSDEDFTRCTEFLNRVDPRGTAIAAKGGA